MKKAAQKEWAALQQRQVDRVEALKTSWRCSGVGAVQGVPLQAALVVVHQDSPGAGKTCLPLRHDDDVLTPRLFAPSKWPVGLN